MKKNLKYLIAFLVAIVVLPLSVNAAAAPSFDNTAATGYNKFFANGTAITVEATSYDVSGKTLDTINVVAQEDADAIIVYGNKYVYANEKSIIFGGSKLANVSSSSITINGGTVFDVYGGGQGSDTVSGSVDTVSIKITGGYATTVIGGGSLYSTVKNATIEMTGGQVGQIDGGGFNNSQTYDGYPSQVAVGTADAPEDSLNRTLNVVINITAGRVHDPNPGYGAIFAGGLGYGYTGTTEVNIEGTGTFGNAGDNLYIVSGGSNGRTDKATINVSKGIIYTIQSVNRGSVGEAYINIDGGTINYVYAGGETSDSSVTGVIEEVTLDITGGTISHLYPGTSGGVVIPADSEYVNILYDEAIITSSNTNFESFGTMLKPYVEENLIQLDYSTEEITTETLNSLVETRNDVIYYDPDGMYSLEFDSNDITDTLIAVDTRIAISDTPPEDIAEDIMEIIPEDVTPIFMDFYHEGPLPGKMTVTINVTDMYEAGDKVYIAHFNETTKKLEWIAAPVAYADEDDEDIILISFDITECSTYTMTATALVSEPVNPQTSDGIVNIIIITSLLLSGIFVTSVYLKKKAFN